MTAGPRDADALRRENAELHKALAELGGLSADMLNGASPQYLVDASRAAFARDYGREFARRARDAGRWQPPQTEGLAAELAQPRTTIAHRIGGLAGWGHNVLLAGPRKTGKTQLALCLAGGLSTAGVMPDGRTWRPGTFIRPQPLGRETWCVATGGVAYVNLEMDADDWRDCFRGVPGTDFTGMPAGTYDPARIWPLHRRGLPFPVITSGAARAWFTGWLRERWCEVLIIDTWGALCEANGVRRLNDDGDVRPVLAGLDEIKAASGVQCVVVLIHTPHQVPGMPHLERFKGAGAVGDWADALWSYVRDEEGTRYLAAAGRARIDFAEQALAFDAGTGLLSWAGTGSRAQTAGTRQESRILAALSSAGAKGVNTEALVSAAGGHAADARRLIELMLDRRQVAQRKGKGREKLHYLPALAPGDPSIAAPGDPSTATAS